ncbi:GlsB/YeaQ/YmgE family stress response membrane protein [Rhodococcus sp. D2-41]|uniref:GlsB/YeaQ/YmgE family stress response membrane protein n=1 Tax=Speluncibacter jeojiensis TaxID=2710754 RepID=UPI0024101E00|nr:GlsB/YeaQ/YmgE family stress response membrane protein [Rhodococcus sp. D2-41]MDG3009999.1 GlsB/YeaQ/YmgE family stress response membrane protein [Rhodococcus sp. D2-41]
MLPLSPVAWVVCGALAGWAAARLIGFDRPLGRVAAAAAAPVIGVLGGLLGGGLLWLFGAQVHQFGILGSALAAVFGAVLLLWLVRTIAGVGRPR